MKYIDLKSGIHSAQEHFDTVRELRNNGYNYVGNTFGNPIFFNPKTKDDVCILSSIITQEGYFAI